MQRMAQQPYQSVRPFRAPVTTNCNGMGGSFTGTTNDPNPLLNPIAGGVGFLGTMAGVLIAYLTGRAPPGPSDQPPRTHASR